MKKFIPVFILIGVARSCRRLHNRIPHWNADSGSFRGAGELWLGLWQGLIIYLSFIASWFDNNVVLYQVNNNGFWYNFGYLIGLWITIGVFAGGSRARTKARRQSLVRRHIPVS